MKKLFVSAFAAGMILLAGAGTIHAAEATRPQPYFVDENGDGICDYYNENREFIDEDGDGICDNYQKNGGRQGNGGQGRGLRQGLRQGTCRRYNS